jgi:hypothetical protein
MAQIRRLKKDIDYMIFEVISDCFSYGSVHPDEKEAEVTEILADAVSLRNDLIRRVNNSESHDSPKATKTHFHGVKRDLFLGVDNLCTRLSVLAEKKN